MPFTQLQLHQHRLSGSYGTVDEARTFRAHVGDVEDAAVTCHHILAFAASPTGLDDCEPWGEHFEPLVVTPAPSVTYALALLSPASECPGIGRMDYS
jgi:hypothetical protein